MEDDCPPFVNDTDPTGIDAVAENDDNYRGYAHRDEGSTLTGCAGESMVELDPITPSEAVQLYLDHRQREVSKATLQSHKSRLNHFILWCEEEDIDNLNDLSGRDLHEFRLWRRNFNGGIKPVTEKSQMDTFRVFIRFVESIDGVREGLSERVLSPDLDADENVES